MDLVAGARTERSQICRRLHVCVDNDMLTDQSAGPCAARTCTRQGDEANGDAL